MTTAWLHAGDQPFDPLVDRPERILAQHRALSLIVELEVHPINGEVASGRLGGADELTPQPCPRGLGRLVDGRVDRINADHPPAGGQYPTSKWKKGETVRDDFQIYVPPGMNVRGLNILMGFWDPKTDIRLPLKNLDAILEKALRLCGAAFGTLYTHDGERFRAAAMRGLPAAYTEFRAKHPPAGRPGGGPAAGVRLDRS